MRDRQIVVDRREPVRESVECRRVARTEHVTQLVILEDDDHDMAECGYVRRRSGRGSCQHQRDEDDEEESLQSRSSSRFLP